jgi:hypothetical protein
MKIKYKELKIFKMISLYGRLYTQPTNNIYLCAYFLAVACQKPTNKTIPSYIMIALMWQGPAKCVLLERNSFNTKKIDVAEKQHPAIKGYTLSELLMNFKTIIIKSNPKIHFSLINLIKLDHNNCFPSN